MRAKIIRKFSVLLLALVGLTACVTSETSVPSTVVSTSASPIPVAAQRSEVGPLLNAARAANGLAPLQENPRLSAAAQVHAEDMQRRSFFSHKGSNGSAPSDRVRAQGYNYCFVAENIAQGWKTPSEVMKAWMNSAGHRKNNLAAKAKEFGAARTSGNYWVLVFGRSGC